MNENVIGNYVTEQLRSNLADRLESAILLGDLTAKLESEALARVLDNYIQTAVQPLLDEFEQVLANAPEELTQTEEVRDVTRKLAACRVKMQELRSMLSAT